MYYIGEQPSAYWLSQADISIELNKHTDWVLVCVKIHVFLIYLLQLLN